MTKKFFNISDLTKEEILAIIENNKNIKCLENKSIGLLFEKQSTRTRLSFSVGISRLGGHSLDIRFDDLNISRDESFEDTFRAMDCYLDGLVYRTNDHKKLIQASSYFKKPIINALSDQSHPCQILSDLLTLKEKFGSLECNILWMGDMNNVCFSLVEAANLIEELSLTICTPKSVANKKNWLLNSNISITHSLNDIDLQIINCVMTDVFISMNDKDNDAKIDLLKPYSVNAQLMSKTNTKSVFMHCLPAKVGLEVSDNVFSGPKSIVWRQAYNRMVTQKKLIQFLYH
jgi:ornithine carbamoyltransferase